MEHDRPNGWTLMRFSDLLTESRVLGSQGDSARRLSIRLYGKGVVPKINDRPASSATRYYRRNKGQFIYSKLDFLNGAFGIIPDELDGYESTLDLPAFDIAAGVDPDWLFSLVTRPAFYRRYRTVAIGSRKARRVPVNEFLASVVTVPPPVEQRGIANVLRAVNRTIAHTEALINELGRTKHCTMHELLTQGHPAHRTELVPLPEPWRIGRVAPDIERMPKHWQLVTLTDVARLESGHTPSRKHPEYWEGDIRWISLQDTEGLKQLVISETVETTGPLGIKNSSARLLPKDTVVLLRTASVGLCSKMGREMATSQHCANWVCGQELDPDYLVQVFRHMKREWHRLQAGSVLPDVSMPVFKRLKILLPPRAEQEVIAAVGMGFDERILAEERYLEQLREAKRGLAQALLSGRIRVREAGNVLRDHDEKQPVSGEVNHA